MPAASSNTIDLSRLPPPTIVAQLTFEEIVAQMIAEVQARLPGFDATVDSDPAVKVLQAAAYRELLIRQTFNDAALQLLVAYATGGALDHLAALVGVFRLVITPGDPPSGQEAIYEGDDALSPRRQFAGVRFGDGSAFTCRTADLRPMPRRPSA